MENGDTKGGVALLIGLVGWHGTCFNKIQLNHVSFSVSFQNSWSFEMA